MLRTDTLAMTYISKCDDAITRLTSRPSQNSDSVIWPPMTNSRCKPARSVLLNKTFFRSRNSLVGSFGVPDLRDSLTTDCALEVDGLEIGKASRGVAALATGKGVAGVPGGFGPGVGAALRLRLIMFVSSTLNFSRSTIATACGDVKVKLWPASSPTNPIFSRTCAEPSLLQNSAFEKESQPTART